MAELGQFVDRWRQGGGAERANCQIYLSELCEVLGVGRPLPQSAESARHDYVFERDVVRQHRDGSRSLGRIDLYKRDCFILEAKQGADAREVTIDELPLFGGTAPGAIKRGIGQRGSVAWATAMQKARLQAEGYGRDLPDDHGWPPFVIVVDVGYCFEIYANFARTGKAYNQYPDKSRFRIYHDAAAGTPNLAQPEVRELLRAIWTEPMSLDPSRHAAKVTREVAGHLAALAKSLEAERTVAGEAQPGWSTDLVAQFLVRCLFSFFAEDIGLLPLKSFERFLTGFRGRVHALPGGLEGFWNDMNRGSPFSGFVGGPMPEFNGGLFANPQALPLTEVQLELLIAASATDWKAVEPAIFGTLLERALSDKDRHKLGAHYTPRSYVERLVIPTVIEPLRADWQVAREEALLFDKLGKMDLAEGRLWEFMHALCAVKVLDPACGSGNFLYVTLEHMKRLEGEVLQHIEDFTGRPAKTSLRIGERVSPVQLRGIEINARAAAAAEAVVWIGYLQWHFRSGGTVEDLPKPVFDKFRIIECRDAVLAHDPPEIVTGEDGRPVTRWDGEAMKVHPVTGKKVPDDSKRVPEWRYPNARKAEWPAADFVVGNPPFLGNKRMRELLGDGYAEALRGAYADVPDTVDFVMYWWHVAGQLVAAGKVRRAGLITTNSIRMAQSRPVIAKVLDAGASIAYAIPDHPWVDTADGAAVRVSMTSLARTNEPGVVDAVAEGATLDDGEVIVQLSSSRGQVHPDLRTGAAVSSAVPLRANSNVALQGVIPLGEGFRLSPPQAAGITRQAPDEARYLRRYRIGRDIVQGVQEKFVIDFFGMSEAEAATSAPNCYQHLLVHVKPERDQNKRDTRRINWWLFGESAPKLRGGITGLDRYVATIETSKFKPFVFMDSDILPDHKLYAVCTDDAAILGILSSRAHQTWALAAGGTLEDRPTWTNTTCFLPFPFPAATDAQTARIRDLGERLDAHRKRQQSLHPDLTLTGMYNVLAALRADQPLTVKEKVIHEQGLCSLLLQLHNELNAAVFEAYGWPADLDDEAILQRLVDLNAERAAEERTGLVRWLRPDFQDPNRRAAAAARSAALDLVEADSDEAAVAVVARAAWPKNGRDALAAVRTAVRESVGAVSAGALAAMFDGAQVDKVEMLLDVLAGSGAVVEVEGGWVLGG